MVETAAREARIPGKRTVEYRFVARRVTSKNKFSRFLLVVQFLFCFCTWGFAQVTEDSDSFNLRNAQMRFSISKRDGHVSGGWNAITGEKYLTQGSTTCPPAISACLRSPRPSRWASDPLSATPKPARRGTEEGA